ncbi:antibiotic biosynthesis monooxygenase family protein [Frankia sp. Cas3]|uniref:antibiotic biosynthesis monooxygenase family protein n=1 Tax=Frankia sp. Cas3 TaxID=3073926 RepID=UPI002AD3144C|nr:antibiotic biosynthesis monooxygenase family protein [Frankia sp. Cas3]
MGRSNPFRVMLTQQILPGREREFEETWLEVAPIAAARPANLGASLIRSASEPGTYYIVGDWIDEDAFREFESSTEHRESRKRLHALRTSFSIAAGTAVAHLPGAGAAEPSTNQVNHQK